MITPANDDKNLPIKPFCFMVVIAFFDSSLDQSQHHLLLKHRKYKTLATSKQVIINGATRVTN